MEISEKLLAPARLKIKRAKDHVNDLSRQINAYLAKRPVRLVTRANPFDATAIHILEEQIPVPNEFSLIAGDAIHNTRSALDIVIFGMVGDRAKKPDDVQFPFGRSEKGFTASLERRQIHMAGKHVVNELKALKPYEGGNDALHALHRADIADKHRLIITVVTTAELPGRELEKIFPGLDPAIYTKRVRMPVGAAWSQVPANEPVFREGKYERDLQPTFDVVFGEGTPLRGEPVIEALSDLVGYADAVCVRLVDAFLRT